MKTYFALLAAGMLGVTQPALGQLLSPGPLPATAQAPEGIPLAGPSPTEREIALVRLAEIEKQIDLSRLAYEKASSERVRRFASKMEAIYLGDRAKLQRLLRTLPEGAPEAVVVTGHSPAPVEPVPRKTVVDEVRTVDETGRSTVVRRGDGSQDPSFGGKPDPGSLEQYNRNTVNLKADNEEDRARLRRALSEQSTPTVLERRREVERPITETRTGVAMAPAPPDRWVRILREISAQRFRNARRFLTELEGPAFDENYLWMEIAAHQRTIDADEVYATYLTGDQRQFVEDELKATAEHLREAESLLRSPPRQAEAPREAYSY